MRHFILSFIITISSCVDKKGTDNMQDEDPKCTDIEHLVQTINENPDILHLDYTPSVHKLSECGLDAVRAIIPLLESNDATERMRAYNVLSGVLKRMYGWKPGQGFPTETKREALFNDLLKANGNYQADAPLDDRRSSIQKWKQWLNEEKGH